MPFKNTGNIRYYVFESFQTEGVIHGAITRQGGLSPEPWSSLNVGSTVGDDMDRVIDNRKRLFEAFNRQVDSLYDVWQVHGREVVYAQTPRGLKDKHIQADIILTDRPGVTLFMRFADCVPIFLYDPVRSVIGLVHAGWQGTIKHASKYAVEAMKDRYGSRPQDIFAGIGPSIGLHHYQVGPEVALKVRQVFGQDASALLVTNNGDKDPRPHFDLWNANRLTLEYSGVNQIELSGLCTACSLDDWYSHRAEKGRTGRFGALIAL